MAYEYTRENNLWEDICYLVKKVRVFDDDGVEKENTETKSEVYCLVGGVYAKEFYEASQMGIKPQYKIIVSACDYNGEMVVEYDDVRYSIYRKYPSNDSIELYLRSDVGEWE